MKNEESYFLHNEACPRCRSKGWDIPGDNLAIYSDGHAYCWSCNYYRPPSGVVFRGVHKPTKQPLIKLPDDSDTNYSDVAVTWIARYDISRSDMLKHRVLWSDEGCYINHKGDKGAKELIQCDSLLIFPVWGDGELLAWQGRYFGHDKRVPKWIGRGKLQEVYNIMPGKGPLVLTEAAISAMKVNKYGYNAMPLYGMHAKARFKHLKLLGHTDVVLWLDPGMDIESVNQARVGRLEGLQMHSVLSSKKPKDYTREEINSFLTGSAVT